MLIPKNKDRVLESGTEWIYTRMSLTHKSVRERARTHTHICARACSNAHTLDREMFTLHPPTTDPRVSAPTHRELSRELRANKPCAFSQKMECARLTRDNNYVIWQNNSQKKNKLRLECARLTTDNNYVIWQNNSTKKKNNLRLLKVGCTAEDNCTVITVEYDHLAAVTWSRFLEGLS